MSPTKDGKGKSSKQGNKEESGDEWIEPTYNDEEWFKRESSKCQQCEKTFDTPALASECITGHGRLRCYFCFATVKDTDELFKHFSSRHQKGAKDKTLMCPYCDASTPYKSVSCHVISAHMGSQPKTDRKSGSSPSSTNSGNKSHDDDDSEEEDEDEESDVSLTETETSDSDAKPTKKSTTAVASGGRAGKSKVVESPESESEETDEYDSSAKPESGNKKKMGKLASLYSKIEDSDDSDYKPKNKRQKKAKSDSNDAEIEKKKKGKPVKKMTKGKESESEADSEEEAGSSESESNKKNVGKKGGNEVKTKTSLKTKSKRAT